MNLQYPIEVDGREPITSLTFRRLKAKDMRRIAAADNHQERGIIMLSCATDLPMEIIDEMDVDDLTKATEAMADFLPTQPQDGEK